MEDFIKNQIAATIILAEFGYIGAGAPKTPEEKRAVLRRYGVSSEKEAREKAALFKGGCSHCGQEDCPTETRWGIVDMDHNEKPAYYAVRDALEGLE